MTALMGAQTEAAAALTAEEGAAPIPLTAGKAVIKIKAISWNKTTFRLTMLDNLCELSTDASKMLASTSVMMALHEWVHSRT
jgi:hypothetical protein